MNDARSALVILVPEVDPLVAAYRQRHDPSAARGMPAHITLLYPFLPLATSGDAVLTQLQVLFAAFPAFPYALSAVRAFPSPLSRIVPYPLIRDRFSHLPKEAGLEVA